MKNASEKNAKVAEQTSGQDLFWFLALFFILLVVALWSTTLWIGPADENRVADMDLVQGDAEDRQEDSFSLRLNADGLAIVQIPSSGFRADQKPILRLSSSVFDPTINTIFLWETYDGISGQQLLTQPLLGAAVHDLSANPNWRGLIRTMGLQFSIVPDTGFRSTVDDAVSIQHFSLTEGHWFSSISASVSAWMNMDSVTMRTPSHVGFAENGSISPTLALGVVVLIVSLLCWWFLSLQTVVMVFVLLCFLLSFVELSNELESAPFYAKSTAYYSAGIHNDTDRQLRELADTVKIYLRQEKQAEDVKIMVASTSDYGTKRLVYHLLPNNAGEIALDASGDVFQLSPPLYILWAVKDAEDCGEVLQNMPFDGSFVLRLDQQDHCLMELL